MTDLKQAAQMALEALRYPLDISAKLFDADKAELMNLRAINALRKALEEQPEKYTFGTPLLDLFKVSPGQIVHADAVADPQTTHWEGCEAVHPECRKPDTDCHAQGICQRSGYSITTTRKPLTDEEIDRVTDQQWAQNNHKPIYAAHRAYARAIERAHGIGEQHE